MSNITRYSLFVNSGELEQEFNPYGDYVHFEDHQSIVEDLEAHISALEDRLIRSSN
jgi:hypothetical protein